MTTMVVLAEQPAAALPEVREHVGRERATDLYEAMLCDVCTTIQHGDADLLVNYPDPETVPDSEDPEAVLRDVIGSAVPSPEEVRYEVQVGGSKSARIGNAVTHLLDVEEEETVAVVEATAPFLRRQHVGSAAMKLRSSEVVLGPAPGGEVYFAGFREPIDFESAYESAPVESLTARATGAGHDVDFLAMLPLVESGTDLGTAQSMLRARARADRIVPERTAAWFETFDSSGDAETAGRSDSS